MAEHFKVWIEIERIDEDNDIYEDAGDLPFSLGTFDTVEEAQQYVNNLVEREVGHESLRDRD